MDLRLLRYFVATADAGSATRAAEVLHVTQPVLSRQLRQLETNLGVPLFAREGRRLRLTRTAEDLLPRARDLLAHADDLERAVEVLASGRLDELHLAVPSTTLTDVLAPFLATLGPDDPVAMVRELDPRGAAAAVRAGADLASGTMDVVPVSPGLFFVLGDPLAQGGVLNQENQYAIEATPAQRGRAIQIFGTGQGPVDVTTPDGDVPPAGTLARATGVTRIFISVDEAEVLFSGLSPQFPGLWQVNAMVPDKPYITGQVPLIVTIDGVPTNQVSFWVSP